MVNAWKDSLIKGRTLEAQDVVLETQFEELPAKTDIRTPEVGIDRIQSEKDALEVIASSSQPFPSIAYGNSFPSPQSNIKLNGIDDSMVVDFSLEKFNHVKFTLRKKVALFFEDTFSFFTQSICLPFFLIIYNSFFKLSIHGKKNIKNIKGPVLFVSNHIGFYDSFIFDLFVHPFSKILPFRFMGSRVFIVPMLAVLKLLGIIDIIYFFFGVFRVTPGEGAEKSLKKAYEIIKNGGTVAMYPEGRIWHPTNVHPEAVGPFKWGAAILAKNTGVQVVPVAIVKTHDPELVRTRIDVQIGRPFFVDGGNAPEVIALDMHEKVVELYNMHT